jgi:hypothetical protein
MLSSPRLSRSRQPAAPGAARGRLRAVVAAVAPVAVPVVLAAGYFALWACATAGPATMRSMAPLPPGEIREIGSGGFVAKDLGYGEITGGGQLWWTRRVWRFNLGYTIQGGQQGLGPTFTARFWLLDGERLRLGLGTELGLFGPMLELPIAMNPFGNLWLYALPKLTSTPNAAWAAGGLAWRFSRVGLILEGGHAAYLLPGGVAIYY